jgi:N-acetylneuraminate synthase/N,N'-diacetyllegionaminate synthase
MGRTLRIAGRLIGDGKPPYIIAEAGVNHNGRLEIAKRLVEAALAAGADAVKFQTFRPEALATARAPRARYQRKALGRGGQVEMLRELSLSAGQFRELRDHARKVGITFLSTPFDEESARFLASIGVPAFKIGSGDLTNHPLIRLVASFGKPVMLSTGMATMDEVREAAAVIRRARARFVLLHCTSCYPARLADLNLRAIPLMREELRAPVGYSDHSLSAGVGAAAVALGACVLEKHLTLDRSLPGPDHAASADPKRFAEYARNAREAWSSLGMAAKAPTREEREVAAVARRSIVASVDIPSGTEITAAMLTAKRPGTGIPPSALDDVVGRTAVKRFPRDGLISWEGLGARRKGARRRRSA